MQVPASHPASKAALLREMSNSDLKELKQMSEGVQQRNREGFKNSLERLVQILFQGGPLWRAFRKWTGHKTMQHPEEAVRVVMSQFDSLQLDHIEGLKIRLLAPLLVHRMQATTILQINTKQKVTSDFIQKHLPHLHGFQEDLLRGFFRKSFKKLILIQGIVRKIEETKKALTHDRAAQENLSSIQANLTMWALQFQFKTAKIPIMDQKIDLHLPFLDYINDNFARYYRGDGGAIVELYLSFLQQKAFSCLSPGNGPIKGFDKVGIIAFSKFSELLRVLSQKPFDDQPCHFVTINDRAKWPEKLQDYSIVDVSRILAVPLSNDKLGEACQFIQEKLQALPKHILMGGAIELGNDIGLYILFTNNKETGKLLEEMETYQGAIGGYPEVGMMRRTLVELQFPLDQLVQKYPFRDALFDDDVHTWVDCPVSAKVNIDDIKNEMRALRTGALTQLGNIAKPTHMTQIYCGIISNFLIEMETYVLADPLLSLLPAVASIQKLKNRIQNVITLEKGSLEANVKFQKISQEFSLMMEEILFLLIYLQPASPMTVRQLESAGNTIPFFPLQGSSMQKSSQFASSGMASYVSIFNACAKFYSNLTKDNRMEAILLEGCYFEVADEGMLRDYLSKTIQFTRASVAECGRQRTCHVICLDLYPNYAPLRSVSVTPVVKIVQEILSSIESRPPLTLILDTSTTIVWNQEIRNIIDGLSSYIQSSRLNLVLVSSLAKYAMCGWDRTPGGLTQLYYHQQSAQEAFNAAFSHESLSPEGILLASMFLLKNREQIDLYIKVIFANTDYVYDKLEKELQASDACLLLGKRQSPIPILSFHFHQFLKSMNLEATESNLSNCTYLLFYYMAEKAQQQKLPLLIRPSFGFPHAALTECHTALRCTIGIEDKPILDSYVSLLSQLDKELRKSALHSSAEILKDLIENRDIKDFIEEHQVEVVSKMHLLSFHDFVEMLHKMKPSLPILPDLESSEDDS